ncbi:MAG: tetratricopeptide repeat protein [Treponema sp.]|nr:tetratricopeptide repeat protein [Treponema sp.]
MKKSVSLLLSILLSTFLFAEQPLVKDIKAQGGKGQKITITWTLPSNVEEPITKLYLYRSLKQITNYQQIKDKKPLIELKPSYTGYIDTVSDFKDYFYAVIAVTDQPYDLILLSFNSTVSGAHLTPKAKTDAAIKIPEEKLYPDGALRETPLPFVDILDQNYDEESMISEETLDSTKELYSNKKNKKNLLKQYIFEEDLISPDGGDDYLLFEILKNSFVQRKYDQALTDLNKLVGTNISESTRNRAYFYIGEAQYLTGDYQSAVKTFIKIQQVYPVQAKKWLDSALNKL